MAWRPWWWFLESGDNDTLPPYEVSRASGSYGFIRWPVTWTKSGAVTHQPDSLPHYSSSQNSSSSVEVVQRSWMLTVRLSAGPVFLLAAEKSHSEFNLQIVAAVALSRISYSYVIGIVNYWRRRVFSFQLWQSERFEDRQADEWPIQSIWHRRWVSASFPKTLCVFLNRCCISSHMVWGNGDNKVQKRESKCWLASSVIGIKGEKRQSCWASHEW